MENKKHKILRIIITGVLSVLLLIPSCLWGTRSLYAEGEAPTKQTLGNMLITLLASFGVKTYIGVANSAQWVADNYEQFINTVSGLKSAYQIYEEVQSTYDPATGKSTLSADAYNSIAQYVRNFMSTYDVVDDSNPVEVGTYTELTDYPYIVVPQMINYQIANIFNTQRMSIYIKPDYIDVRGVYIRWFDTNNNEYIDFYPVSTTLYYSNDNRQDSSYVPTRFYATNSWIDQTTGITFYCDDDMSSNTMTNTLADIITVNDVHNRDAVIKKYAYQYTFGSLAVGGELSDNIYYQGDQSLNDMVSTTDQNAVFDWSKVAGIDKTLAEILEAVNEIALTDAWETVNFPVPDAKEPVPSVPVPDNTPIPPWWDNIPELEAPSCPTLSACIVSGARAVSDNISSLMNLHSELAIYTGVGLSLGLALLIIGAFRR